MDIDLIPIADKPMRPATVSTHYGRAGKARDNDQALAAGYEAGMRDPGAWHHIGKHMRADAPPIDMRPRWLGRTTPRRNHVIRVRVVIALALISAAVLILNITPSARP